ncbi:PqiB family protein [Nitrincola tapanii]|uniref:MCE family protein n=1 Tax=Nitrincola tapanii TaxID=1708751 RepID=A0A5A9W2I6_9GAMM|nr:MlaD family protein [Nitrincola tapanii]KAA0874714.1 MCE family protein [Nitrincola tapanii]
MSDTSPLKQRAVIRKHRGPSVVWLLPLLAALIAGWLVYKTYQEAGIMIEVVFESAEGLEAGKTRVMYKGLAAGDVRRITLNEDFQSVTAHIEMNSLAQSMLNSETRFWLVKPQVSLQGVSGLETLISGYYIGILPGEGESQRQFIALTQPPPPSRDEEGLYITLRADSARSLQRDAPVFFRSLEAGRILDYRLDDSGKQVLIDLYIRPEFATRVTERSRFWNASGIQIDAQLPDITLHTGSLLSMISGGIHFDSPDFGQPRPARQGAEFTLYADEDSSREDLNYQAPGFEGVSLRLLAPALDGITRGSALLHSGIKVGQVTGYQLNPNEPGVIIYASLRQRYAHLLRQDSRFWRLQPVRSRFSLQQGFELEMDTLRTLIQGGIAFSTSDGPQAPAGTHFTLFNNESESHQDSIRITLEFPPGPALHAGSQIRFREQPVGEILSVSLLNAEGHLFAEALLYPEARFLARAGSRFWVVQPKIRLSGVRHPEALLLGNHVAVSAGASREPRQHFVALSTAPAFLPGPGLNLVLTAERLDSLDQGSQVFYRGVAIGEVSGYQLSPQGERVEIYLHIQPQYQSLVTTASQFRNVGGIRASAGLFKGLDLQVSSLETLLVGGIELITPGSAPVATEGLHFPLLSAEEPQLR